MDRENSNSRLLLLILIRPADSLCSLLSAFLTKQGHEIVLCSSIYDVLTCLGKRSDHTNILVILRPSQLPANAGQYFDNLHMIGWLDSEERMSDRSLLPDAVSPMVMVSSLAQLERAVSLISEKVAPKRLKQNPQPLPSATLSDRLDYDLSDAEINALLGVNQ